MRTTAERDLSCGRTKARDNFINQNVYKKQETFCQFSWLFESKIEAIAKHRLNARSTSPDHLVKLNIQMNEANYVHHGPIRHCGLESLYQAA